MQMIKYCNFLHDLEHKFPILAYLSRKNDLLILIENSLQLYVEVCNFPRNVWD